MLENLFAVRLIINQIKYLNKILFLVVHFLVNINHSCSTEVGDYCLHPNTHQEFRNYKLPSYLVDIQNIHSTYLLNDTYDLDSSLQDHITRIKTSLTVCEQSKILLKRNLSQSSDQYLIYKFDNSLIDYIFDQLNIEPNYKIKIDTSLEGYSGASITLFKKPSSSIEEILIVIKSFRDTAIETKGLQELGNLLVANQIIVDNNLGNDLKFSRVLGAFYQAPLNQHHHELSIIFEGALGQDINETLSQFYTNNQFKEIDDVFANVATYLAKFHHAGFNQFYSEEKFKNVRLNYVNKFTKKFYEFALNKEIIKNLKQAALTYEMRRKIKRKISDQLTILDKINLNLEATSTLFRKNIKLTAAQMRPTVTHGDIHSSNVFFNSLINDTEEPYKKITLIDYETMVESYQLLTHPAQDIGWFLGSIWRWSTTMLSEYDDNEIALTNIFEKVKIWQQSFLDIYIKNQQIDDTNSFKNNVSFHIKNFFRILLKNPEPDYDQLAHILQIWLDLE